MTESDAYVRDHLLIQFMLHNYSPISFADQGKRFEEDIYHRWILYLKELEAKHDKGSTV